MRWFKRQALAALCQYRFQFGHGCATAHGDHQLGGLVAGDAGERAHVQHLALQRLAVKVFAAATADAQRGAVGSGRLNAVGDVLER